MGADTLAELWEQLCGVQSDGRNGVGGICAGSGVFDSDGWRCFLYIPHRTGIDSDNYKYGILLTFPMVGQNSTIKMYRNVGTSFQLLRNI